MAHRQPSRRTETGLRAYFRVPFAKRQPTTRSRGAMPPPEEGSCGGSLKRQKRKCRKAGECEDQEGDVDGDGDGADDNDDDQQDRQTSE